ncbi:MAG: hypothetical protein JO080_08870, partial [Mucilaginibacter sp.]|nr:hypothetical protein [Mucilaginibacter sp.]
VIVMGFLAFFYEMPFKKNFETPHDKYIEQNFVKGILVPDLILNNHILKFYSGTNMSAYSKESLLQGVVHDPNVMGVDEIAPLNISFKLIGDRLYIYSVFKDFDNENVIGTIDSNSYMLKSSNFFNFKSDDRRLEVYDNKNDVVFSIQFEEPNLIRFKGYVVGKTACLVSTDNNLEVFYKSSPNYRMEARSAIDKIPRIFP